MKKIFIIMIMFLIIIPSVLAENNPRPNNSSNKEIENHAGDNRRKYPGKEVKHGESGARAATPNLGQRSLLNLLNPEDRVARFEQKKQVISKKLVKQIYEAMGINVSEANAPSIVYYELDKKPAFCLDEGKFGEKSLVYKNTGKGPSNPNHLKYLKYHAANHSEINYALMQIMIWRGKLPSYKEAKRYIDVKDKNNLLILEEIRQYHEKIKNRIPSTIWDTIKTNIYEPVCGDGQRLLAAEFGHPAKDSDFTCDGLGAKCIPTPEKPCKKCKPTPKNNYCKDPIVCETKSELAIAENCGMTGQYKDIFDWNCLAGDDQFYDDSVFEGITNGYEANYCRFYCREEVETTFPGDSNYRFYAGRFFTIGMGAGDSIWGPISVYGKRTCRSFYDNNGKLEEGVNWNKFIKDLNFVKGKIKSSYEKYKHDLAKQKAGEKSIAEKQDNSPNCVTKEEVKYCCRWDNHVIEEWGKDPCAWSDTQYYECDKTIEYGTFYPHKEHNVKGFRYWDNIKEKVGGCDIPTTVAKYAEVNRWIKEQERIMNIMGACERANPKYHLSPRITFNYSSTAFNYGGGDIVLEPQEVGPEELERQTAGGDGTINYIVCSPGEQEHCRDDLKRTYRGTVANKTPYKTEKEITIGYKLPTEGYKYITKSHGSAGKTIGENLKQNGTYMDFPYPIVLPLDFKLQTGNYDLSITYQNIGNQYGSGRGSDISPKGKGWFDYRKDKDNAYIVRGGSNYSGGLYNYACNINIENDILKDCSNNCDHIDKESNLPGYYGCIKEKCPDNNSCSGKSCVGGIDVIYRPIQLQIDRHTNVAKERGLSDKDVAFPSYKSNGRKPGANWSLEDVHRYINCNRSKNVTLEAKNCSVYGDQVYKEKPMYTIKLDPAKILEIRKYNKAQASNGGYADFDSSMKCKQGRNCISSFIHQKYRHYFDSNQSTCLNSTIENFECRYQH